MNVVLIRHGQTPGNRERRYVGRNDQSLCEEGIAEIQGKVHIYPKVQHAFISPMKRTRETKALIYGELSQTVIDDLRECSFGDFEGKSYDELKDNPDYQRWIEHNVTIPNAEPYEEFKERAINGFVKAIDTAFEMSLTDVAIVLHGGTTMAIMERFSGDTDKTYYDFMVKNGEGYTLVIDKDNWYSNRKAESYKPFGEVV